MANDSSVRVREGAKSPPQKRDPSLDIQVLRITPELAAEWLKKNENNRRQSRSTIDAYARDMKAGKWLLSGDPIRFEASGDLIDGQHRLKACIKAGVPFHSVVICNLDFPVMRVIDHLRVRTVADNLHIEGKNHSLILAASAKWLYVFKHGSSAIGKGRITATEVLETVDKHPKLEDSCRVVQKCFGVTPSLLSATHYVAKHLLGEEEKADSFAAVFVAGKSFYDDDAALVWRERLLRMKESRATFAQDQLQRGTIHAWNSFKHQIPIKMFRIPDVAGFTSLDYSLI